MFTVTSSGTTVDRWLKSVGRRAVGGAERYERRVKAHFRRYKVEFTEGYTLPGLPTPELRVIYDSAARNEGHPVPRERTLHCHFTGLEYHWRSWPLDNVVVVKA